MVGKIEGTGPVRSATPVKRTTKTSSAGGASFAKELDETSETSATNAMSGTSSVSGVFGIQEVDDALSQASKGKLRAMDILDRLEELRVEILTGRISRDKLLQLTHVVTAHKSTISDPQLLEVLDHIDLRAQVELAKYIEPPIR